MRDMMINIVQEFVPLRKKVEIRTMRGLWQEVTLRSLLSTAGRSIGFTVNGPKFAEAVSDQDGSEPQFQIRAVAK